MFGTERMLATLNADPDASPEDILKNVEAALNAFEMDSEQFDDLTMLCMEYKGRRGRSGADAQTEASAGEKEWQP